MLSAVCFLFPGRPYVCIHCRWASSSSVWILSSSYLKFKPQSFNFTSNNVMANSTAPIYKKLNKDKRGGNAAKENPRTPVTSRGCWGGKNSDKGYSKQLCRASPWLWVLTEDLTKEYMNAWSHVWTRTPLHLQLKKKIPEAKIRVKHYLVVYPTSNLSAPKVLVISYQNLHPNTNSSAVPQGPPSGGWHSGLEFCQNSTTTSLLCMLTWGAASTEVFSDSQNRPQI